MLIFINLNLRSICSTSLKFQRMPTFVQGCPSVVLYSEAKELSFKDIRKGESSCELKWPQKALFELRFEERGGEVSTYWVG